MAKENDSHDHTPVIALRPREAAKALSIGTRLLWQMTASGEIPHTRMGRAVLYPVDDLREWLRDRAAGESRR